MKAKNTDYSRVRAREDILRWPHSATSDRPALRVFDIRPLWRRSLALILMLHGKRGAVENTNKLIRQYIPKHTNFDEVTDKKIASIQKKINSRPRKKLKFETPKTEFFKRIA